MLTGLIDSFRSFKPKRVNGLDLSYIPYVQPYPMPAVAASAAAAGAANGAANGAAPPAAAAIAAVAPTASAGARAGDGKAAVAAAPGAGAAAGAGGGVARRLIAMCAPSKGGMYDALLRNDVDAVAGYLDEQHGGHYRIYNLTESPHPEATQKHFRRCAGGFAHYPIPDHQVPRFRDLLALNQDLKAFMDADVRNVAAVHCKAGKGRTGTAIVSFLIYIGACATVEQCMELFATNRSEGTAKPAAAAGAGAGAGAAAGAAGGAAGTSDDVGGDEPRGVDQASQVRWLYYWHKLVQRAATPAGVAGGGIDALVASLSGVTRVLQTVRLHSLPNFDVGGGCEPYVIVRGWGAHTQKHATQWVPVGPLLRVQKKFTPLLHRHNPNADPVLEFNCADLHVTGECLLQFWDSDLVSDEAMCRLWFHPALIDGDKLALTKAHIDDAWNSTNFKPAFRIELFFKPIAQPQPQPAAAAPNAAAAPAAAPNRGAAAAAAAAPASAPARAASPQPEDKGAALPVAMLVATATRTHATAGAPAVVNLALK